MHTLHYPPQTHTSEMSSLFPAKLLTRSPFLCVCLCFGLDLVLLVSLTMFPSLAWNPLCRPDLP